MITDPRVLAWPNATAPATDAKTVPIHQLSFSIRVVSHWHSC